MNNKNSLREGINLYEISKLNQTHLSEIHVPDFVTSRRLAEVSPVAAGTFVDVTSCVPSISIKQPW